MGRLIPPSGRQRVEVKTWEALADIAVGCALGYLDLRCPDLDWRARHANLARLLDERLMPRPSFADTVPA